MKFRPALRDGLVSSPFVGGGLLLVRLALELGGDVTHARSKELGFTTDNGGAVEGGEVSEDDGTAMFTKLASCGWDEPWELGG